MRSRLTCCPIRFWKSLLFNVCLLLFVFSVIGIAQSPLTISGIQNQRTFPNLSTRTIPFTVSDAQTPAVDLILTGSSSNPSVVPDANIVFGGSGSNRNVTVTASGTNGTDVITITARNSAGATTSTSFQLTVAGFTDIGANLPQVDGASVAWGDYDNDGWLDLLLTGGVANIYHNNGDGTFTNIGANLLSVIGGGAVWGDYNNDGRLDVLLAGAYGVGYGGYSFSWRAYRNNGSNIFAQIASFAQGGNGGNVSRDFASLAWGDYDNDGKLDALFTSWPYSGLFHNSGNDSFVDSGLSLTAFLESSVGWADYNNDGNLDFVVTHGYPNNPYCTELYKNDGRGSFTFSTNALPGTFGGSLAWADFNNDGNFDIALVGGIANGIYAGDGRGNFTNVPVALPDGGYASVTWGDIDNDGLLDIVLTSADFGTRIFRNQGDGTFADLGVSLPGAGNGGVAVGDFNNDGCLDIAIAGNGGFVGGNRTKIFRNDGAMPNAIPNPPTNLSATTSSNSLILHWSMATDPNQLAGFSYNVRVGTSPGAIDVVGPMADPATGFRRVPALGNAGLTLSRIVTHLQPGRYYWAVQAIDHAFAGSPFAPEQSFTLLAPMITMQPANQTNILGAPISFWVSAGGTTPLLYQWYFNGTKLIDSGRISGSTTSNLTVSSVEAADAGSYTVMITNLVGSVTSAVAIVSILNPLITAQPQNQSVLGGATVILAATVTGQQPISYQWELNGNILPGATNLLLTLTNVLVNQSGNYSILASNIYGFTMSSNAVLSVAPVAFIVQPTNRVTWPGGSASFAASVIGEAPISYQWQFNGIDLPGAVSNLLVLTNVQRTQFGKYGVLVSNRFGSVASTNADLSFSQVAVWGFGGYGETNLPTYLTNVSAISAGSSSYSDCLALNNDGTIIDWPSVRSSGSTARISNLVAIAGTYTPLGLRADGRLVRWFPEDHSPFTVPGFTNLVAITPYLHGYLALTAGGTVVGDGSMVGLTNIVAIAEGGNINLALAADGTVVAGDGYRQIDVPIDFTNVIAIAAGAMHRLALRSDGIVVAWGDNSYGQSAIPTDLSNVVSIAAGGYHSLALKNDGTVVGWGANSYRQASPPAGLSNVIAIAAGQNHSLALIGSGPPPLTVSLTNPTIGTNGFNASLPTQSGRVYGFQYKNSLLDPNWNQLPLKAGNGGLVTLNDPTLTNSQRFYRATKW